MIVRPRRLRANPAIRDMVAETGFSSDKLINPFFVTEGKGRQEIASLPGIFRYSVDELLRETEKLMSEGLRSCILFGIPDSKDSQGSGAWDEKGIIQRAVISLKHEFPDLYVITDLCLCEYTDHGHCGVFTGSTVDNDATLPLLARAALSQAASGADMIAPSDMMDGRVRVIREALDKEGFTETPIMAYSVKYASSFYGPFREAAASAPKTGDRKGYQMDYRNRAEGIREALLDAEEGADIIMVKPALAYLDVIAAVKGTINVPLSAFNVSGEYAMVKAASRAGWIDGTAMAREIITGIFRAGADFVISYHTPEFLGNGGLKS